jgi:ribulose-phosphate 3-epimerase
MIKVIVPSVIAETQAELETVFSRVKDIADLFQLDVMDSQFVPPSSLDFNFTLPGGKCRYEAQLMVEEPKKWIEMNGEKVDTIIAQIESVKDPESFIEFVKERQKKVGFALKPETDIIQVRDYLENIDQVLVMTVHPGYYGGEFLPEALDKVKKLRALQPELDIEVDGGIKPDTIIQANAAGANMFVCGSYLVKADSVEERMSRMDKLKKSVQAD